MQGSQTAGARPAPRPATGRLGVLMPGLGAVATTFIAGVLGYSWFRRVERMPIAILVATVPVALLAADRAIGTEIQLGLQAIAFAALVLLAAELSRRFDPSPANPLVKLGDWSYGLYLMHVPVILAVIALTRFAPGEANDAFISAASTAIVVGCAYGWIEIHLYRRNKALLDSYWSRRRDARVAAGD